MLIESGKAVFSEELCHNLSVRLGENENDIHQATDVAVPTILAVLLYRTEFSEGPLSFYHLAHQAAGQNFNGWLRELGSGSMGTVTGDALSAAGHEYVTAVLGEHTDTITEEVARYTGIREDNAAFLLGLSAFSVMDAAGRYLRHTHLDVTGTTRWLWEQRDAIIQAVPAGLRLAPALGLKRLPGAREMAASRRSSLIYGIIAIIILAGLLFYVIKSCNGSPGGA